MLERLIHRGPDQSGIWAEDGADIALGHRRLSIQDLSENGRQPMTSGSGRFVIVFNGEIYNFRDLRKELSRTGIRFRGHSDTEVLLGAIDEWGIGKSLERIDGMFAFALYDRKERELHLVRDRIGEKPLYFGLLAGVLYFASELKAIRAALGQTVPAINRQALTAYLNLGYIPAPLSIYENFYKLPPGHHLSLCLHLPLNDIDPDSLGGRSGPARLRPYWSLREVYEKGLREPFSDAREATDALEVALTCSIRDKLVADVEVGCFLSGGIDSSLVAALAQKQSLTPIQTFTIGFDVKEYDEAPHAARIARHIGSNHTQAYLSERDCLDIIPTLPEVYDEPFADSSQIPSILVARLARRHVTVCLSGDGGDELFLGYNRYIATARLWRALRHTPLPLRTRLGAALQRIKTSQWHSIHDTIAHRWLRRRQTQTHVGLKVHKLARLLQQTTLPDAYRLLLRYYDDAGSLTRYDLAFHDPVDRIGVLNGDMITDPAHFPLQAQYWDQHSYLPDDNLLKVDRSTMSVSLESRLPILSPQVIDCSWRMPIDIKLRHGQSKWPLREILYRHVPKKLLERPKMGFSVPVSYWLRNELRDWAQSTLFDTRDEFLDMENIRAIWDQHQCGQDYSHILWTLLMFKSWHGACARSLSARTLIRPGEP